MSNNKYSNSKSKMKNVILTGPLFTNSGYGVHARQVFKALSKRKNINLFVNPTLWGVTSWILNQDFDNGIIKEIFLCSKKNKNNIDFDESYQVLIPSEWKKIAKVNIGVTAGFECDLVKESWIDYCNIMDYVIVPSEFSKLSFVNTIKKFNKNIQTPIKVINEWYYEDFDKKNTNQKVLKDLKYKKNILIMGQISNVSSECDRKNIIKTINTCLKFIKDKKIGLILKVNLGKSSSIYKNKIINKLKESLKEKYFDKITLLFGNFKIEELKSLYKSEFVSCMVSGTRAEGWGLPLVESAVCGLPIIATNYSAYLEFLENDFLKVDYKLVTFNSDKNFTDFNSNPKWAEFCEKSMFKNLKDFFENEDYYLEISKRRKNIIKQRYNSKTIINDYKIFFESLS